MVPKGTPRLRRIRAVVIDDGPEQRQMVEFMLLARGFDVAGTAADGAEGLRLIHAVAPDVVVSDYHMPTLNGLEMVKALRADPASSHLPVLIVTGSDDEGVAQLREMSDVAVVEKPVAVSDLVDAVDGLLVAAAQDLVVELTGRRTRRR